MLFRSADPPSLARQPVRLTHHEHSELGLAACLRLIVDEAEHFAQSAHLRAGEVMAKQFQYLGVADRLSGSRRGDEDRPHLRRIGEKPGFAHCGCWVKSTGVNSNTSSLEV